MTDTSAEGIKNMLDLGLPVVAGVGKEGGGEEEKDVVDEVESVELRVDEEGATSEDSDIIIDLELAGSNSSDLPQQRYENKNGGGGSLSVNDKF